MLKPKISDSGYYLVRALAAETDLLFTSRKKALRFARKKRGLVFDLINERVIENYERR